MNPLPVYLDHHATTPVDPRVLEAMLPYFTARFGNPASALHRYGWEAAAALETARTQVAELLGATPAEIVWTSGATEANNLALFGVADAYARKGDHIVTQATEHRAVLAPCAEWERRGGHVTVLPVDEHGLVDPAAVAAAITERTILVSIMAASNEIGTLQPLAEIGRIARERGVLFHTDAAQAAGKVPLDVEAACIDLLSFSGHKLYAPKGSGVLYVRRRNPRVTLAPRVFGGGHERNLRSGTPNVPGIVGLGQACAIAGSEMASEAVRLVALRERLRAGLAGAFGPLRVSGHPERRLPGNLNVTFLGVSEADLAACMRRVAVSSGSACTSAENEPSHVLRALGLPDELCRRSLRFGLGRFTTAADIDRALAEMIDAAGRAEAGGVR